MAALDVQVKEMKSMGDAIRKLESTRENGFSQEKLIEEYIQSTVGNGKLIKCSCHFPKSKYPM